MPLGDGIFSGENGTYQRVNVIKHALIRRQHLLEGEVRTYLGGLEIPNLVAELVSNEISSSENNSVGISSCIKRE